MPDVLELAVAQGFGAFRRFYARLALSRPGLLVGEDLLEGEVVGGSCRAGAAKQVRVLGARRRETDP
ncbi:MAG TPA: hypothetical protein VMU75_07025 [Acidimicrobiales bacterium]|nr:hypothetical protein [Acidimicrobiales bacterium]